MNIRYQILGDPDVDRVVARRVGWWVPSVGTPVVIEGGATPGDYLVHTVADRPSQSVTDPGIVVVWLVPA